jgi:cysteine synthase A
MLHRARDRGISESVLDAIGDTPMLEIEGIYCKLEYLNPSGSIKARIAEYMVGKAEEEGAPQARRHHRRGHIRQHG